MPLQSYWSRYRCFQKWRNLTEEKWKIIKRHNYGFTDLVRFLNPTDAAFKLCVIILNCRFYCLLLSFIETGRNLKYIVSSLFHCQLGTINVRKRAEMSNSWWFLIGSADLCTLISENRSEDTFSHQLFMLSKFCFMNDVQKCQISKVFASFFCTEESEQTNASTAYSREMALVASSSQTKYIRWENGVNPISLNKTKEVNN